MEFKVFKEAMQGKSNSVLKKRIAELQKKL